MRTLTSLAVALLFTSVAGCSSPVAPSDPVTVELAPSQSAAYGALTVQFVEVTMDSRCPATALCIQAGEAFFVIAAKTRGEATTYELQLYDRARNSVVHAGYRIAVDELGPYPFAFTGIDPDDYRLKLTLSRE